GKTLRRSNDSCHGLTAMEMVSAWASSNRLTLGQIKVAAGSNEITAVPELLKVLALKGCIVTLDAINTQKKTIHRDRPAAGRLRGSLERQSREAAGSGDGIDRGRGSRPDGQRPVRDSSDCGRGARADRDPALFARRRSGLVTGE